MENHMNKKVMLHICCAPDATYPIELLKKEYEVVGFFYNPNIHPRKEYDLRLKETIKVCNYYKIKLIYSEHSAEEVKKWLSYIEKYKDLGEGSKRCFECIKMRMLKTAEVAREFGFDGFTTTLSISPHKAHEYIIEAGKIAEEEYGVKFLFFDFRKRGGFQRSIEISKKLNLYRQNYCGCIFSKKEAENYRKEKKNRIVKMLNEYKSDVAKCNICGELEKRFFSGNVLGRFFVKKDISNLHDDKDFYTAFPKCKHGIPERCYKFLLREIEILKPRKIYIERSVAESLKIKDKIKVNGKKIKVVVI